MSPDSLRPADRRILEHLRDNPPEYIPLIANRLGMHLGYVEERCGLLIDEQLMEPVTNEKIYRLSERGEQYLAGEVDIATQTADD